MSEKTPNTNTGPDENEIRGADFDFPGAEPDDLTEEERAFTFDENYLDADFPPPPGGSTPAEDGDPDRAGQVDRLASLFRDQQQKERAERDDRIGAVFNAFKKRAAASAEKSEPNPADREDEVFAAFSSMAKRNGQAVSASAEAPPEAKKPVSRKRRKAGERLKPDPVTVGQDLRPDQMLVYDSELDELDYTDEEDLPEMRDYLPVRFRRYARLGIGGGILYALFVISVSVILACVAWLFASDVLALNKEDRSAIVTIDEYEPGADDPTSVLIDDEEVEIQVDIDQVATALKDAGIIEYTWLFKLYSQFSHAETKIDPGTYDISTELDYRAIVTALQFGSGNQEITRVTFPEGYTMEQIFTLLEENHIAHKSDLYEAAANYEFDYDFLDDDDLGDASRLEGYLFPDTYDFYQGEAASVAINRFLRNLDNKLTDEIRSAAANRGWSVHELLTMASLIEKESGGEEDRAVIASVIYNRLNAGMPLQLDTTINYILGTNTLDITIEDTEIDSPYNTYLYSGLPAGPICNPGMSSITAVLEPEDTGYWYWYAYEGTNHFFYDYDEFMSFVNSHPNE